MATEQDQHLVISVITQDRPGIVNELSAVVSECGCNIEDSRMVVLGGSFAIVMMVQGNADNISDLEAKQKALAETSGLLLNMQHTDGSGKSEQAQPYKIEIISLDHQGIIRELSEFISARSINIAELNTETYSAPHTGSTMFKLVMTVNIPLSIKIADFRETLIDFCDDKNLDVQMEPCLS